MYTSVIRFFILFNHRISLILSLFSLSLLLHSAIVKEQSTLIFFHGIRAFIHGFHNRIIFFNQHHLHYYYAVTITIVSSVQYVESDVYQTGL